MEEIEIDDILLNNNKKKKLNSKSKGNRAELKVCKILKEHFGLEFNRAPNSGAFGSTHSLENNAQNVLSGDIICPENFLFVLENKCGYDIDLFNFFKEKSSDKNKILEFIEQSVKDALRCNRVPIVIYTKDYRPSMVILPIHSYSNSFLLRKTLDIINHLKFKYVPRNDPKWHSWVMLSFEDFLKEMPKSFFFAS